MKIISKPWAVWLSWLECHPIVHKVTGLIPGQGTHPGCGFSSGWGMYRRQPIDASLSHLCFSLSRSLFRSLCLPLSVKAIKKCSQMRIKKENNHRGKIIKIGGKKRTIEYVKTRFGILILKYFSRWFFKWYNFKGLPETAKQTFLNKLL